MDIKQDWWLHEIGVGVGKMGERVKSYKFSVIK